MKRMGSTTSVRARQMRRVLARWQLSGLTLCSASTIFARPADLIVVDQCSSHTLRSSIGGSVQPSTMHPPGGCSRGGSTGPAGISTALEAKNSSTVICMARLGATRVRRAASFGSASVMSRK